MEAIVQVLKIALPLLYGAAFAGYLSLLFGSRRPDSPFGVGMSVLLLVTVLLHIAFSLMLGALLHHHPMASIFQIFSFMALSLAAVYLWLEHRARNRSTGAFVLPFVAVLQTVAAMGLDLNRPIHPILRDTPFGMHTGSITLAYVSFFLSMIYAVMLLLFYRAMRRKEFGVLFEKLPPLASLARMNLGAAVTGLVFMTPGLLFGLHWAALKIQAFWADPKIYLSAAVWVAWAITVAGHFVFKWNDRRVAGFSVVAFTLMTLVTGLYHTVLHGWHRFIGTIQ